MLHIVHHMHLKPNGKHTSNPSFGGPSRQLSSGRPLHQFTPYFNKLKLQIINANLIKTDCLVSAKRMSSFFPSPIQYMMFNNIAVPVRTAIELPVFTLAQLVLNYCEAFRHLHL